MDGRRRRLAGRPAGAASPSLATVHELRGALPPKQTRSLDATWQIVDQARALFADRGYDAVSVGDIAGASGRSVGAFYTRFPTKEHLLVHLLGLLSEELSEAVVRAMTADRARGGSPESVVLAYFRLAADAFVRHRAILRPATLLVRQTTNPELRALVARFNDEVHGAFRERLLETFSRGDTERVRKQVDSMILWSSAAIREVFLYQEPVSRLAPSHGRFLHDLARAAVIFLEARA